MPPPPYIILLLLQLHVFIVDAYNIIYERYSLTVVAAVVARRHVATHRIKYIILLYYTYVVRRPIGPVKRHRFKTIVVHMRAESIVFKHADNALEIRVIVLYVLYVIIIL